MHLVFSHGLIYLDISEIEYINKNTMDEFFVVVIFIFGLIIGSFLNVCIYRLPREGMSLWRPGSHCPSCGQPIHWYDNIPLVSYLILTGRCRYCKTPISLRYPIVELLTGLLFVSAYYFHLSDVEPTLFLVVSFLVYIYLIGALLMATFIDFKFRIIPDEITVPGIIIALMVSGLFPSFHPPLSFLPQSYPIINSLLTSVFGILIGGGTVYLVGVVGKVVFRKEAMGLGDVKLMGMLGGFLGWSSALYIFFLGCLFGSIVGIIWWLITKERYLAFGPYLALGALVMMFFKKEVVIFATDIYPNFIRNLLTGSGL